MAWIWCGLVAVSAVFGIVTGNGNGLGTAAMEGAKSAVTLVIGIGGVTCLWSGVMEVLERSGASVKLARFLRPLIALIFPDRVTEGAAGNISANLSANLLGLGNAATPLGIAAARELASGSDATDNLCTLVVLNTASIQLIPTTAAALRASYGAAAPFDIIPAVWFTSLISVTAGLASARIFGKIWRR
jgi:spore maturation protein A